ncbi:MAG: two-component regulator propeller domain-containing protein [Bacteroidia bacterium]|jgi:ligand-binding sensor domain-containing protein
MHCLLSLILTITTLCSAYAQTGINDYDLFTTRSGLTHNSVLAIAQDHNGYLWVGTRNGLCRYDGQEFISYADAFGEFGNAWGNAVEAISCYRDEIWIGTRGGLLARLNAKTGVWQKFHLPVTTNVPYYGIKTILVTSGDNVYAGCIDGTVLVINRHTGLVKAVKLVEFPVRHIGLLRDSILVYADQFYLLHPGTDKIRKLKLSIRLPLWPTSAINGSTVLTELDEHTLGFYDLQSQKQRIVRDTCFASFPAHTIKSSSDHFIATNGNVILAYDKHGRRLSQFQIDENESRDKWELINDLTEDREGNIWIGIDHGLVRTITRNYRFKKFRSESRFKKISHNYIRALYAEKNIVWAGTWHGMVNKIDFSTATQRYSISRFALATPTKTGTVNTLARLRNGALLAGASEGLFKLEGKQFERYRFARSKQSITLNGEIWSILEDRKGRLWISSRVNYQGWITMIDDKKQTMRVWPRPAIVWNIYEDKSGQLWFGTENGLERVTLDPITDSVGFVHQSVFARNSPAGRRIWSISEDAFANLWIGTTDNGLLYYNTHTRLFTAYTEANGLTSNSVSGILHTDTNNLWIGTMNGLAMLNLRTKKFTTYTEEDGLISNDFNFKACAVTERGEMFWGTKNGIMSFYPDSVKPYVVTWPLLINQISVMGKPVQLADSISVSYAENMITIKFALLEHTHHKHYYRYQLTGFSDTWNYADERNPVASYTNLPPGTYQLQINGATTLNQWLLEVKKLTIVVQPAFWQTSWFILLSILLVIGMVVLAVYLRIRKVVKTEREKHGIKQKITELELSALQAQMNPHFIFNAIHSIQHFIVHNDQLNANEYLTKFANLMRLFLESSKKKTIPLSEEIEILRLYTDLEILRFEERFDVEITVDATLDTHKIDIPSMLLQPFVENAIIHGLIYRKEKGHLLIAFSKQPDGLLCTIDDNGIGREESLKLKSSKHRSRGMELINDRIRSYNELYETSLCTVSTTDKKHDSGVSAGTRVDIMIYTY